MSREGTGVKKLAQQGTSVRAQHYVTSGQHWTMVGGFQCQGKVARRIGELDTLVPHFRACHFCPFSVSAQRRARFLCVSVPCNKVHSRASVRLIVGASLTRRDEMISEHYA